MKPIGWILNPRMDHKEARARGRLAAADPLGWPLAILALVVMIAIGVLVGGDYGVSIDEPAHLQYGRETLQIYLGQLPGDQTSVDPRQHGPFYSFIAYVGGTWLAELRPGWGLNDGVHFVDYLSLVLATLCIGVLSRRYFSRTTAWIIAGAFFTQPILFGHAFINPKDTPFMAFTLAGLTLGVSALPRQGQEESKGVSQPGWAMPQGRKLRWLLAGTAASLSLCAALLFWGGWPAMAGAALDSAYNGTGALHAAFLLLARNATSAPLDAYQAKLGTWIDLVRLGGVAALLTVTLLSWAASIQGAATSGPLTGRSLAVSAAAGAAIGLATAIRSIAPLFILPLAILYVLELRHRGWAAFAFLALAAVAACVAAWPYLWQSPIRHLLDSQAVLSHFPWTGDILFNGRLLDQGQQPWFYIPELIGLQITLPILGLALIGLAVLARPRFSLRTRAEIAIVCGALALPVLASLRSGTIVYNNFRQFLFAVPALFLLAGLGVEALFARLRSAWIPPALAALILLPGVAGLVRLHPYEYIYYNALAGTGSSVYARFESDYWCTSYREAMQWVDANAPHQAVVAVGNAGFTEQAAPFARGDLTVVRLGSDAGTHQATLAIVCDGRAGRLNLLADAPTLMVVSRAGAPLAQVKDLSATR